ncbi:TetR/AcrR family transcriptional regulator [Streptomyces sp. AC563]|uniref:TetR/AcrR family transcriptional regulator n=1 Tax=Streptomyces buecherae TaxID=2763006 RepID=UPI00164D5D65|nr:TetR/AcrR family transcriptional regulator [Streptomyces buecherae]MBC3989438.1 TetR/AcrR family transcriptional regulator [Streptomyces buecherae]
MDDNGDEAAHRTLPPSAGVRGRRRPRLSRGDRREAAILDSVVRLLRDRPARKITIEEIAKGAGLSRPSVYFYFDSKQAIIDAAVQRVMGSMLSTAAAAAGNEDITLEASLEGLINNVLDTWVEHGSLFCAAIDYVGRDLEARIAWRDVLEAGADELAAMLERDRARGLVKPGGDARALAVAAHWMVERNCYMLFSREHTKPEELALRTTMVLSARRILGLPEAPTEPGAAASQDGASQDSASRDAAAREAEPRNAEPQAAES